MINETTTNGFDILLKDVCLKTNIEGMDDSVLKIALKHYLISDSIEAHHKDKHTDQKSTCTCLIGGL